MCKVIVPDVSCVLAFFFLFCSYGFPQDKNMPACRIMFYNVENLFDTYNDPLKEDDEFLPGGVRRWSYTRYNKKIYSIYQVITAAGGWSPPAIVALCEVENRSVVEDILNKTWLSKYDYGIIHEESPDRRGIDICMIYRKEMAAIVNFEYWEPHLPDGDVFSSRRSLYVKCCILTDTLHVIVNHWPSRRGGILAGEDLRRRIGSMIREKMDSVFLSCSGKAKIIVMGDFNCSPVDQEIVSILRSTVTPKGVLNSDLVNLSEEAGRKGAGTYRYMGAWEMPDQVIVSDYLTRCGEGLYTDSSMFKIFKPDFLLYYNSTYPGKSPFPTYYGYSYKGGFSDHLPLLIDLQVR